MAGSYPDVPARRMAYDRDGTVLVTTDGSRLNPAVLANSYLQGLNAEVAGYVTPGQEGGVCFMFPELRDITGYVTSNTAVGSTAIYTSVDTTNGSDGTWVSRGNAVNNGTTKAGMRTGITTVSWLGVKALEFRMTYWDVGQRIYQAHLYGDIAAGANPNRLRLWHPTSDIEYSAAHFDWDDIGRGTTADVTFRVKNNSATLTANTITVSTDALTDTTPSVPGQHTLSTASVPAYTATKALGNLAPGVISEVITLRRTTASTSALSLWWARVLASAATWT